MSRLTPQAFAQRWSDSTLSERSSYQQHFLDLCEVLGQPTPAQVDRTGESYTFEKGVEKAGGGKGFADVWLKDRFAIEYKGKHKNLGDAYAQLLRYHDALGNPPLLVVTDMERYEVHTKFDRTVSRVYSFTNAELPEPENMRVLRDMFEDPDALKPGLTVESVTEEAAAKFARLADGLRGRGVDPQEAAHFLNKLLFCLFVEDVNLLPGKLFERVVERGVKRPENFNRNVGALFEAMAEGGEFSLEDIRRFNGGLFADGPGAVVPLEAGELGVLLEAARLDWRSVEPAIFGTLFERSLDPAMRAKLGAHYTSREDILAVVEPVLMAPLRREWGEVRERASAEAKKGREAGGQRSANALRRAERELVGFAERLRRVRVLDPACGSGNFLYVALRELLDLEKEVYTFVGEIGLNPFFPGVNPEQLFGIETSPYAHELAQVVVWIGYLQWMIENGFGANQDPILGPMTNIREMDALIHRGEDGTLREPEWPEADVILGNPPFLGDRRMRGELGDGYVEELRYLYKARVLGAADLVCYWFERSREQIESRKAGRAGLLATNSIRGGANRRVLERIKECGGIFFAESDRPWILNGAAVRVSMIGFDNGAETRKILDGTPVDEINSDLTGNLDLTAAHKLRENAKVAFYGTVKIGPFDIREDLARDMLSSAGNPNGRPNSDVVKPWMNAMDVTRRPRHMWAVDFGTDLSLEDAALYEKPFEYVKTHVKPMRDGVKRKKYREIWWLFGEPGTGLRRALAPFERYVATPYVAKHRLFVWLEQPTVPDHQLTVFARDDDYFFGVLHSRPHELWALRMGTSLEDRPRYTPTTCFETFPLPWPPGEEPDEEDPRVLAIAWAARRLDELRRNWLDPEGASEAELKKRTLTELYNARPTWLENAHAALDAAVFAAYGWDGDLPDEEILKNLLALNAERARTG